LGNFPERRKQPDRRESDRQGKYDRRQTRCMQCAFWEDQAGTGAGFCTQHQKDMAAFAFSCALFEQKP